MEETILKATTRVETPKKVREAGFIPGVLNGPGTLSTPVQFESTAMNKIIAKHGPNAKVWVQLDTEKKFGFIKEVQKSPMDRKILHVAILLVSVDQEVKMQLPISFHGKEELEHRQLQVQVYKSDVEVMGKTALLPDGIIVDVSKKELGDSIFSGDFHLIAGIKILDPEHEVYAVIKAVKEVAVEEPAEEDPTEK